MSIERRRTFWTLTIAYLLLLAACLFYLAGQKPRANIVKQKMPAIVVIPTQPESPDPSASSTPPIPVEREIAPSVILDQQPVAQSTSTKLENKPPQFVILAFDGSYSIPMWKNTRAFAQSLKDQGIQLKFTYFISGVYLLANKDRMIYLPPEQPAGKSAIGFAASERDVADRIEQINLAINEGHEIGSHANGHFNGSSWKLDDWNSELSQFQNILQDISTNNHLSRETDLRQHINIPNGQVAGFRAPELGRNAAMYTSLASHGYRYDTSDVGHPRSWPQKTRDGLWEFPLAQIDYATTTFKLLSMDYNFYFKQTNSKDEYKKDTPEWNQIKQDMIDSYVRYFNENYGADRAPIFIGHHFSEWNDGAYWEAMKAFASQVCGLPDVRCTTFSDLADYLDAKQPSVKNEKP